MSKKAGKLQNCQVVALDGDALHVWQFHAQRTKLNPTGTHSFGQDKPPPTKLVANDWKQVVHPRLTIGWMPGRDVFLRVIQLPKSDTDELLSMVELQMERLSPMPVSHICWAMETQPHADPEQITALVTIVNRERVDEFLAALEAKGIQADRLDVAWMRQLTLLPRQDGLWLVVGNEANLAGLLVLSAWRVGGVLREVAMTRLPTDPDLAAQALVDQLNHAAWAAEMEGWLSDELPVPHLCISPDTGNIDPLRKAIEEWAGQSVIEDIPFKTDTLAIQSASDQSKSLFPSLMPSDISQRYRQDFVDRLWVRALGAIGMAYLVLVVVFLGVLNWRKMGYDDLRIDTKGLALSYTNVVELRAQMEILEEQVNLRFAALDSWQAAVDRLPATLTLTSLGFRGGRTLSLQGTAPANAQSDVTAFNAELQRATVRGQPLFTTVEPAQITMRGNIGTWSFSAELQRASTQ
jgi:hypothetical protein